MKKLDILQICELIKLGKVINNLTSPQDAADEVINIIGPRQVEDNDWQSLWTFFLGLTAHKDK